MYYFVPNWRYDFLKAGKEKDFSISRNAKFEYFLVLNLELRAVLCCLQSKTTKLKPKRPGLLH